MINIVNAQPRNWWMMYRKVGLPSARKQSILMSVGLSPISLIFGLLVFPGTAVSDLHRLDRRPTLFGSSSALRHHAILTSIIHILLLDQLNAILVIYSVRVISLRVLRGTDSDRHCCVALMSAKSLLGNPSPPYALLDRH